MEKRSSREVSNRGDVWNNLFVHNLGIKLLSCVCAILAWLVVTNIADPYKEKNFSVSVETINEDAISSANMVYEIVEGNVANVTVGGKRSLVDKLSSEDFSATADLSELSSVNAVPIKAKLKKSSSSDLTVECNQVLKISLESKETKQIKVSVNTTGEPGSEYSVGECVAKPNVIEVTGGESVIDQIDSVGVTVNVNGATENFSQRLAPAAYDKKGRRVSSSTLSFNVSQVRVQVKLLQKKTIPVKLQVKGKPAKGYEFVDVSNSPEEIEIAGSKKMLQTVSQLVLPVDITDLTDSSSGLEQNIHAEEYLPDGISIPAEEERNISVKIQIEKLQTKKVNISFAQIKMNNLKQGYMAEFVTDKSDFEVEIQGRESVLSALSASTLTASVNCDNQGEGIYSLPIELNMDNTCTLKKAVYVKVSISKKVEDVQTPTSLPDSTQAPQEEATVTPVPTQGQ